MTKTRLGPTGTAYSPGLVVGDTVYLAGQGGTDPATGTLPDGIEAQTEQALRNVEALLQEAGRSLADVDSCLVHLADLDDFPAFNETWLRMFPGEPRPVRTTVGAPLLLGMLVEITAVAS